MSWTLVPKTTIDEHRDLLASKNDIRPYELAPDIDWMIDAESKTSAVERRSGGNFGLRVAPPIGTHADRHTLVRRRWIIEGSHHERWGATAPGVDPDCLSLRWDIVVARRF